MSSELQFERLTKAAVAFSYMSSVAKVRIFLHIPMLFADYLMDSYSLCFKIQRSCLKGGAIISRLYTPDSNLMFI